MSTVSPLAGLLDEQAVLVQVRRHDGPSVCTLTEVAAAVRLDAQRQVHVGVDVEEVAAEDGGGPVARAEGGVAGAVHVGPVLGELVRDAAVEAGEAGRVGGRGATPCCGGGDPVELGLRDAADVDVRHDLAVLDGARVVEAVELVRALGALDGFEVENCFPPRSAGPRQPAGSGREEGQGEPDMEAYRFSKAS